MSSVDDTSLSVVDVMLCHAQRQTHSDDADTERMITETATCALAWHVA